MCASSRPAFLDLPTIGLTAPCKILLRAALAAVAFASSLQREVKKCEFFLAFEYYLERHQGPLRRVGKPITITEA